MTNPLLLPVVVGQAIWLRTTMKLAQPPTGPAFGVEGEGTRTPIRLAVVGESTAAGFGVDTHAEGFAASVARELAALVDRRVEWQTIGQFGATARRIRHRLIPRITARPDVVIVLAGGNDVLARRRPDEWRSELTAILDALSSKAERTVVSEIPRFANSPAFPSIFAKFVDERASEFNEISRELCAHRPATTWITCPPPKADDFASDGLHPNKSGYRKWAGAVVAQLLISDDRPTGRLRADLVD